MALYLRNIQTGAIKTVEPDSKEFADTKEQRTDDGRFPLWEQTSQDDASPREDYEVANRQKWDAKLSDVTTDGVLQSGDHAVAAGFGGQADLKSAAPAKS